jgi:hypothetical protein
VGNAEKLHLLALLLAADEERAEEFFVCGLDECINVNHVFRDWAHSWARRAIIKNAVRVVGPCRTTTARPPPNDPASCRFGRTQEANAATASILALDNFERFVFVLSVLCRYSDHECSILMECPRQYIQEGRVLALQHVAEWSTVGSTAECGRELNDVYGVTVQQTTRGVK